MTKRRRWNRPLWTALFAIAAVAALYAVGTSLWLSQRYAMPFTDLLVPRLVDLIVVAWLFWVGSAIGSFLNVVAYRLPLGRGVGGFSACPFCATPIAGRDNVPVFGWLALRGRCRRCRLPISPRYPLVELAVGLSLTLVGVAELYLAGVNLPYVASRPITWGALHMPHIWTAGFAIGIYHVIALACSWALGLVRVDGVRLPRRLVWWCLGLVIVPMLLWPPLQVVPWEVRAAADWQPRSHLSAVLRVVTGAAAAGVLARALAVSLFPTANIKLDPLGKDTGRLMDLIAITALAGIVVGWQALLSVLVLACALAIGLRRRLPTGDALGALAVAMPVALTIQLLLWRVLDAQTYWPGTHAAPWVILTAAFVVLAAGWWLRAERRSEI
ncbi:prepilin peptidase [Roseimaritima sediminicola]|uniref:prepilin peptidase n=1 Tax=Roseimaritima sediminicola TaxID=2662066 RepID=UPI0028F42AF3|nr:prepilin peptidase [Roseimaritima sediminicola]